MLFINKHVDSINFILFVDSIWVLVNLCQFVSFTTQSVKDFGFQTFPMESVQLEIRFY